ncbi:MAG TPA: thioredoxin family protein [Thermoanaerobaculia bacterium]|jgi:peroxiredoxin|nr:thioredoxin family protein [Thermoanaerobaculia bacterium]
MKSTLSAIIICAFALVAIGSELAVGAKAPAFALVNATNNERVAFAPGDGKLSAVIFTCNQCPYSKAFEDRIVALGRVYGKRGVRFYAIDPNDDDAYPVERLSEMKERATTKNYPFPYLKDGDSAIARAYGARVTPHVFVIDGKGAVRYRGYVDDSAKAGVRQHTGLQDALDALLAGREVQQSATRAFGCSIKFRKTS